MKAVILHLTLWKKMSFSVHDRNVEQLTLEMEGLAPTIVSILFLQCSNNRHTISQSVFSVP